MSDADTRDTRTRRFVSTWADVAALALWMLYALALMAYWPATLGRDFVRYHRGMHDFVRVLYVGLPGVLFGALLYAKRTRQRSTTRSLTAATITALGTSLTLRLVGEFIRLTLTPFAGPINRTTGLLFVLGFLLEALYLASFCSLAVIALVVVLRPREPRTRSVPGQPGGS